MLVLLLVLLDVVPAWRTTIASATQLLLLASEKRSPLELAFWLLALPVVACCELAWLDERGLAAKHWAKTVTRAPAPKPFDMSDGITFAAVPRMAYVCSDPPLRIVMLLPAE